MVKDIFSKVSKYKLEIIGVIGIVALYLVTRVIHIGNFPIFTDEAIYVRWTQIAKADATWRFISLTDGKQPLFIWFGMIFQKIFQDPLVALRLVSVLSGLFTMFGLFALTRELFRNRFAALISMLLYVFFPFAVVYDRMALYDSMVAAFAVWAIYFSILLVRKVRLDIAYTLGFVIGGGMLTKSNAEFSIFTLPLTLLLFDFKNKQRARRFVKWAVFALFSVLIAEAMYNALRLSPFFHIIAQKNTIFVYPISEWLEHPFTYFLGNLKGLTGWLFTYLTPFYAFLILASFFSMKYLKEKVLLIIYFLLPFLADALFGKVIFPRHIFFTSIYLLPLAAMGLFILIEGINAFMIKRKLNIGYVMGGLLLLFFILYPGYVSANFILNPENAKIADADINQYVKEWPAGGGVAQSINFFEERAKTQKIFIGTEGTFGLMPASLEIYLGKNPNIMTKGYWPTSRSTPPERS